MLPLLLAGAKSLAKKENPKTKKVNTDSLLKKSKSGSDDSKDIKKSSSIVLRSSSAISTKKISTESFIPKKEESVLKGTSKEKRIGFEDFIKELKFINKTLDSIKEVLKKQISNKEEQIKSSRVTAEKLKKKKRESDLEKKKPKGEKKEFIKKPSVSFLDAIINFLTNVFLGTLAVFALDNLPKIIGIFDSISKDFNIWTALKFGILALTNGFRRSLRFFLKITGKLLSGPAKLIGKTIGFAAKQVGKIFKSLGSKVFNLIKGPLKNLLGPGLSNALGGAARGAGSILRRGATRALPRLGAAIAGRTGAQVGKGLGILTGKGLKHFSRIGGIFKRIPVVGALIALGIDLALGVPPDEAVVGAIGGSIGAGIGAGVGSLILPLFGTAAGGFVGGIIGDWLGKELYKWIKPKVSELLPKQEDEEEPSLRAEGGSTGSKRSSSPAKTALRTPSGTTGIGSTKRERWNKFMEMGRKAGSKFPELVAAQFALESGWGEKTSGRFNYFGIKATAGESATLHRTQEYSGGRYVSIIARFKNFSSPQDAVNDLVNKWYKNYKGYRGVNRATSSFHAAQLLKQEGYATDISYVQKLKKLIKQWHGGKIPEDRVYSDSSLASSSQDTGPSFDVERSIQPPPTIYMADIRGAANQKIASSTPSPTAPVSSANPASSVAPSVSAEPSYQQPQSVVVPIPLPQPQQPQQMPSGGGLQLIPIGGGLNRGDAYREVLNVSLYKR
jgi:flagellum-specific peptidoglycan hydrolase FlgJ